MKQRPRIYYTEEQKALMWDLWQRGESLHAIARLFDRGQLSNMAKQAHTAMEADIRSGISIFQRYDFILSSTNY